MAAMRFVRMSARKCRRSIDLVRGLAIDEAIRVSSQDCHRGAYFINKVLRSAAAGAMEKGLSAKLVVSSARVDEGPTIKRFRPRAQGRAYSIMKRTSHIIIGLKVAED